MVLDVIASIFSPNKNKGDKIENDTRSANYESRRAQHVAGRADPQKPKRQHYRSTTMVRDASHDDSLFIFSEPFHPYHSLFLDLSAVL